MKKLLLFLALFLVWAFPDGRAQGLSSPVTVDPALKGDFRFTESWDYPWDYVPEEQPVKTTGRRTPAKAIGRQLRAGDTAHLFFTARCTTNVQGGYAIRYCFATRQQDSLMLSFSDGLPAYASSFYVRVYKGQFVFRPDVVYPVFQAGERIHHRVTRQKLALTNQQERYRRGDLITGYIDVEFTETVSRQGEPARITPLFLRGYFRTPVR